MATSAFSLEGRTIGEWTVGPVTARPIGATGGNFSCCYPVLHKDGTRAFLKALDFSKALGAPDPVSALMVMTEAYDFERSVLRECKARRMDRVVAAIDDGKIDADKSVPGSVPGSVPVPYLIFEWADRDLRSQIGAVANIDLAWKLRSLHHMATGLRQLHNNAIAHQDLKPSNVLVFDNSISKIADVGCASKRGAVCPRDGLNFAGGPAYAPPELFYGYLDPEWSTRRLGCDAYLGPTSQEQTSLGLT